MIMNSSTLNVVSSLSRTETTPWTTSSTGETTATSIHSSDTNYEVESLKSGTDSVITGRELTAQEIEWLHLTREYTLKEKPFEPAKPKYRVVRKLHTMAPKHSTSWTMLRRKLNGREDVKNILTTKNENLDEEDEEDEKKE